MLAPLTDDPLVGAQAIRSWKRSLMWLGGGPEDRALYNEYLAKFPQDAEVRQHLTDAVSRVLSMSVIHEFLSHDEHRPINIRDVCQRIASQVIEVSRIPAQSIDVRVQGPTIRLPASQATPMALVINELLMNGLEHGLAGRSQGSITVILHDLGDRVKIMIEDDGEGLPDDFDIRKNNSLGLQIVQTMVTNDLKGTLDFVSLKNAESGAKIGTQATITFPKRPLNAD